MSFTSYEAYNLKLYYSTPPGTPGTCPACGGGLTRAAVEPSLKVRADLKARGLLSARTLSSLFSCKACGWWCVRESFDLPGEDEGMDYIITAVESETGEAGGGKPWLKALADPKVYEQDHARRTAARKLGALFPK